MKFSFPLTDRQRQMLEHPARMLWCGTATKTGKSAASYVFLIQGLLKAEATCFVGPWFFRSRRAFDECKVLLEPFIRSRQVRVNESRLQITSSSGGYCDFQSADNPDCLFGGNYDRLVLDESSRMPEAIHGAAVTTISATGGRLRLFFNLELGSKNWSIRNLLRVQRLSPDERVATGEDFLTFPTDPALVDPALVATLRSQMPEPLWRALYLAEIPDSDFSLFRNLDKVFTGHERETPADGVRYFLGVDLARKKDFTSATVISEDGHVVAMERFSQMDWSLQVQRVALLYRTFCCGKAVCDSTGLGDPVCEQLEDLGLDVERYTFTVPSRKALLEELILSCDNTEITVPASEKFKIYRAELESFEYVLDGVTAKYAAPGHDDCVMSLALAVHGFRAARGWVLGLLDLLKRKAKEVINGVRDSFGELVHKPEPKVVAERPETIAKPAVLDNFAIWLKTNRAPACPLCKSTATTFNEQRKVRCNQCQSVDGVPLPKPVGACCGNFLPQMIGGGGVRCGNCGAQSPLQGVAVGVSRSDYAAGVGRHRSYRRFG